MFLGSFILKQSCNIFLPNVSVNLPTLVGGVGIIAAHTEGEEDTGKDTQVNDELTLALCTKLSIKDMTSGILPFYTSI